MATTTTATPTPTTDDDESTTTSINIVIKGLGHNIKLESIDPSLTTLDHLQSVIETHTKLPPCYQRLICSGKTLTSSLFGTSTSTSTSTSISTSSGGSKGTSTGTSSSAKEEGEQGNPLTLAHFGIGIQRHHKRSARAATATTTATTSSSSAANNPVAIPTTKIILMHNSIYVQDKTTIDQIMQQSDKLTSLEVEFDTFKQEYHRQQKEEEEGEAFVKLKTKYHHQITDLCCKLDAIDIDASKPTSAPLRQMRKKVFHRADLFEKSTNDYFSRNE